MVFRFRCLSFFYLFLFLNFLDYFNLLLLLFSIWILLWISFLYMWAFPSLWCEMFSCPLHWLYPIFLWWWVLCRALTTLLGFSTFLDCYLRLLLQKFFKIGLLHNSVVYFYYFNLIYLIIINNSYCIICFLRGLV